MDVSASKCYCTIYGDNKCPSNVVAICASSSSSGTSMQQAIVPLVKSKSLIRATKRIVKKESDVASEVR